MTSTISPDSRLVRRSACTIAVDNPQAVDTTIFATEQVPIETAAVDELVTMLELQETAERFAEAEPARFARGPVVEKVAITPDFHKAKGIPVGTVMATRGFVVPQAIGSDINCGMRLHTTGLTADVVRGNLDLLEDRFRHLFFAGGRNLPMTRTQREALLREGLKGLLNTVPRSCGEGLWKYFHEAEVGRQLGRIDGEGSLAASSAAGLENYLGEGDRPVRDQVTGCVGGGNHFVEL